MRTMRRRRRAPRRRCAPKALPEHQSRDLSDRLDLSPTQAAIVGAYFEGRSKSQIVAFFGVSGPTVVELVGRARAAVRAIGRDPDRLDLDGWRELNLPPVLREQRRAAA